MANNKRPITVTILTKPQCGYCEDAQELLQRLEGEYWLSVDTVDIQSTYGEALAKRGGILFPPGIFLDGEPFSYGRVSERKLRRELDRRIGASTPSTPRETDGVFWPELDTRNRRSMR
jgi:glutaredoxin